VDVFFVISGYLITRNILHDIELKRFSFSHFYRRRIKRLFPALLFTLVTVLICGYLFFSPADLERLGHSLQYAIVSLSNFFFWTEAGYFNETSELKPLLHTWSLAIEEQYYLIWPAVLFGISLLNKKSALLVFLLAALVCSLILNVVFTKSNPSATFFLLPFRVFEFAIGGLCVLFKVNNSNKILHEVFVVTGLVLIFGSVLIFNHNSSYSTILPTLGAALIIVSNGSFVAKHVLSFKWLLKIGLASYSIYLIHWPLMVFYKYWKFTPITLVETMLLLFASILLGFLMWHFIEKPFRKDSNKSKNHKFWMVFFSLLATIFILGFITQSKKGFPQRFPSEYFMSAEEISDNRDRYWKYFNEEINDNELTPGEKEVIVMGNSHAIDLIYALRENGSKLNITILNTTHECYNFGSPIKPEDTKKCNARLSQIYKNKTWQSADAIYLHDHWPVLDLKDLEHRLHEIRKITEAPIFVLGPKMTYYKRVPEIILSHMRMSSMNEFAKQFSHHLFLVNLNQQVADLINKTAVENVSYVDILKVQCGIGIDQCEIVSKENAQFLYFDYSHFTLLGAKEFGEKLKRAHPELF
jgi:peptidoglycan/LPS O-acetylase OafA/YrhL